MSAKTKHGGGVALSIITELEAAASDATIADARIGVGYTGVRLADGGTGAAFTFSLEAAGGCSIFHRLRPLAGRSAAELLPLVASRDVIEAGVGLACANALANRDVPELLGGDVLEHVELRPDDEVAMVGHFGPLVETVRERVASLTIYERVPKAGLGLRPSEEAPEGLRSSSVALITATSLVNGTCDELLDAARGCREVVLMGPSTPLLPEVFAPCGVTLLAGVIVAQPDGLLQVVSEAGGMRQFRRFVRKAALSCR